MYYHLVNDKIVLTDENFEIPKIYTVISEENASDYYEYFVENKNGERWIDNEFIEMLYREGDIKENSSRFVLA